MTYRLVSRVTGRTLGIGTLPECRQALRTFTAGKLFRPGTLDLIPNLSLTRGTV